MRTVQIFFIYAENCKHCEAALNAIQNAIKKCKKINCRIVKFLYNSEVAIQIAIAQNINDLPGFVVGSTVFNGSNYSEEDIVRAIIEASNVK